MRLNELISGIVDDKLDNIHTILPAKILKFDPEKMKAEIKVLVKNNLNDEEVEIPKILEVPVSHFRANNFVIRPPYQKDDKVLVGFSERALDNIIVDGKVHSKELSRTHSLDDAIVLTGLKMDNDDKLPSEQPDSLYIANLDKDVKIFINPDGTLRIANDEKQTEIVIESDGIMRLKDMGNGTELKFDVSSGDAIFTLATKLLIGSSSASEGIPLGNTLKDWLDNHTHGGVVTGGGTSGKPNSASPSPSSKAFVE